MHVQAALCACATCVRLQHIDTLGGGKSYGLKGKVREPLVSALAQGRCALVPLHHGRVEGAMMDYASLGTAFALMFGIC